jgi:anti-sigma factor RsiW
LSNELTVEADLDVLRHLERCPRCTEELETKRRVKHALKSAMDRQEPAPIDLQQKILKEIRPQTSLRHRQINHQQDYLDERAEND